MSLEKDPMLLKGRTSSWQTKQTNKANLHTLIAVLWDPKCRTPLSCTQTPDPLQLWDKKMYVVLNFKICGNLSLSNGKWRWTLWNSDSEIPLWLSAEWLAHWQPLPAEPHSEPQKHWAGLTAGRRPFTHLDARVRKHNEKQGMDEGQKQRRNQCPKGRDSRDLFHLMAGDVSLS